MLILTQVLVADHLLVLSAMVSENSIEITGTTPLPTLGKSCSKYSLIAGDFSGRNTDTKMFAGSFAGKNLKRDLSSDLVYSSQLTETL